MADTAALAVFSVALASAAWFLVKRFALKDPLDNIPGPPGKSFLSGNFLSLFGEDAWALHDELADKYGNIVKTTGLLGQRILYVADPTALQHILLKDQDIYEEHPSFISDNGLFFGEGLLATLGDRHKKQRKLMNPVFSTAHMRNMVPIFQETIGLLRGTLEELTKQGPREVDMLHWMGRTAMELIGRSGLGFSFDSLAVDDPGHPAATCFKEILPAASKGSMMLWRTNVVPYIRNIGPAWFRRAIVDIIPSRDLHRVRDYVDIIAATSKEIYTQKKAALAAGDEAVKHQIGQGKDILSLLIRANSKAEDPLDEVELLAQMSTLIFAATDTTSSALSRTFYLLAQRPDVQDRIREEIRAMKQDTDVLTYDDYERLPYLDAMIRETLRLYPPVTMLMRKATKDAILPFGKPVAGVDGRELAETHVPRGTSIIVSIHNANRSKELWGADALEWKPERWLAPLPDSITNARMPGIYSNLLTFLGGGRACIGFKFSQLEMKVALVEILDVFRLELSPKTIKWRMGNISTAIVEGDSDLSQLPILLSRAA
ncbi:cytochrome P450 [Schizophyllum fasciatum]